MRVFVIRFYEIRPVLKHFELSWTPVNRDHHTFATKWPFTIISHLMKLKVSMACRLARTPRSRPCTSLKQKIGLGICFQHEIREGCRSFHLQCSMHSSAVGNVFGENKSKAWPKLSTYISSPSSSSSMSSLPLAITIPGIISSSLSLESLIFPTVMSSACCGLWSKALVGFFYRFNQYPKHSLSSISTPVETEWFPDMLNAK